ncbi:MAG: DUF5716 family protein [Roseburia sp.]
MENPYYLGIDLDDENAVVSFFQPNRREPETISMIAGSEKFQIPVLLAQKEGEQQWVIGEEAAREDVYFAEQRADRLLGRALNGETLLINGTTYHARELFAIYLKKILLLARGLGRAQKVDLLVICLDRLTKERVHLFSELAKELGIAGERLTLIDRKESFYYFTYCQKEELTLHEVCLFDYRKDEICCCRIKRNQKTKPQLVTLSEETYSVEPAKKDISFLRILREAFSGHIVSAVYLMGEGFDGDWMKESVAFLCRGRRAFIGKNLYSKGACYAAAVKDGQMDWEYAYMGESEMKGNVCLKLFNKGVPEWYTLIRAGDNRYEAWGSCEVLLSGTPEIDFWLKPPVGREAKVEKVTLADLPQRPDKTTRIRITARPLSDTRVQIQLEDLGFGELFESSKKVWEYEMSLGVTR